MLVIDQGIQLQNLLLYGYCTWKKSFILHFQGVEASFRDKHIVSDVF